MDNHWIIRGFWGSVLVKESGPLPPSYQFMFHSVAATAVGSCTRAWCQSIGSSQSGLQLTYPTDWMAWSHAFSQRVVPPSRAQLYHHMACSFTSSDQESTSRFSRNSCLISSDAQQAAGLQQRSKKAWSQGTFHPSAWICTVCGSSLLLCLNQDRAELFLIRKSSDTSQGKE